MVRKQIVEKSMSKSDLRLDAYKYGFHDPERYVYRSKKGLDEHVVKEISYQKGEPEWMQKFRLESFKIFKSKSLPAWGPSLSEIDFDGIYYYLRPVDREGRTWDEVPEEIRRTYERLGIPKAEKEFLAGVKMQYDSEVIYGSLLENLKKKGVIFLSMDEGLKKYPEIVKQYIGKVVPMHDNKFAALNSAVWSGGSFIYIPEGMQVELPLQAYFRINAASMGQFERTLIIVEPGSYCHYIEGCTSPIYTTESLHAAVVEIVVKSGARVRYTTIQNWSHNVYNLVTKRSVVHEEGIMEWVDCNLGSNVTMKYPSIYLIGKKGRGEVLSMAYAGRGQHQDAGGKAIHNASETTSKITSKSISANGGRTSYRGLLQVSPQANNCRSKVVCEALILDEQSRSDTYPTMNINNSEVTIEHEATVSKIGEEKLFYLMSRGLPEEEASALVVNGFIEPIVKELPLEYAVEMNRLIELEMEGSVG